MHYNIQRKPWPNEAKGLGIEGPSQHWCLRRPIKQRKGLRKGVEGEWESVLGKRKWREKGEGDEGRVVYSAEKGKSGAWRQQCECLCVYVHVVNKRRAVSWECSCYVMRVSLGWVNAVARGHFLMGKSYMQTFFWASMPITFVDKKEPTKCTYFHNELWFCSVHQTQRCSAVILQM